MFEITAKIIMIIVLNCILYLKVESFSLKSFQDGWVKSLNSCTSTQHNKICSSEHTEIDNQLGSIMDIPIFGWMR